MKIPESNSSFKAVQLPNPGVTFARCVSLIDIGTVENNYMGQVNGTVRKVFITWELPAYTAVFSEEQGPKPFVVSKELTLSLGDRANLAKIITNWRNKPFTEQSKKTFDILKMVGKPGMLQFVHKTKQKYAGQQIDQVTNENTNMSFVGISPVYPGVQELPQVNESFIWDWDNIATTGFDMNAWKKVPKFIREKIRTSEEFKQLAPPEAYQEGDGNTQATATQATAPPPMQAAPPAQSQQPDTPPAPVAGDGDGW